ncbi:hypothetical protein [Curtobacterium oceanosedimentum]|uniref:hypothetical protein n=1 Tax=Curtobacterium oceanosedimentum TaxID=465820 RepID=UPI001CE07E1B|nr:hypothetical protein [Curtobacterium oceanosedimentum]MCA5923341.1 hypothetical protein [Curtobacterium oceanosedimentum]
MELRTADLRAVVGSWGWLLETLGFHAGDAATVERIWAEAPEHGWTRLYEDRHPFAGGPDQRAAFLEDAERIKVELVAD